MQIIKDIEQGSTEWHAMRLARITASKVSDIMTNGRGGTPSVTSDSYMMELIAEKLTGMSKPFFENDTMKWGNEKEPDARFMYELKNNVDVEQVAFVIRDEYVGMSPDGLVGDSGLLEIKCPATHTQLKRALSSCYHKDYKAQIQMQLWVSEREWCDFVSFDPRINAPCCYLEERVYRDETYIQDMQHRIEVFIEKMNSTIETLTKG